MGEIVTSVELEEVTIAFSAAVITLTKQITSSITYMNNVQNNVNQQGDTRREPSRVLRGRNKRTVVIDNSCYEEE